MSRAALASPYLNAHDRSVVRGMRRGAPPRGLPSLMRWYIAQWDYEVPDRLHVRGTWHDAEAASALGAPQDCPTWTAYLYGSDMALDKDGYYCLPLHAALCEMTRSAGVGAWEATYLLQLAFGSFDWQAVGARFGMDVEPAEIVTTAALVRLWEVWTPQPMIVR